MALTLVPESSAATTTDPPSATFTKPGRLLTLPVVRGATATVRATAMVFADPKSRRVLELMNTVAPSEATILVIGETGTGKEIIARHIHARSRRSGGTFAAVNCGALAENLIESELFGHEQGSFTGASGTKPGWFEAANGGTLFLDEIGDLPLAMQVKLLRVLQEREVVRVGGRHPIPVDVRLVAATNVDLHQAVLDGLFRADLYYRLRVMTIDLPLLRERPGDILPLAEHFLDTYCARLSADRFLGDSAQKALLSYAWPGNIRELENAIHRSVLIAREAEIKVEDLLLPALQAPTPVEVVAPSSAPVAPVAPAKAEVPADEPASEALRRLLERLVDEKAPHLFDAVVAELVMVSFAHAGANQMQAAESLGLSRCTYRTLLKRYGMLTGDGRAGRLDRGRMKELLQDGAAAMDDLVGDRDCPE